MSQEKQDAQEQTAIQPVPQPNLNAEMVKAQSTDLALIKQKSQLLIDSGMLPKAFKIWQQVAVVMMRGRELDVPDLVALQHIFVVYGNSGIDAQMTMALLERSGLLNDFQIIEATPETCTLRVKRIGRKAMDYTCTRSEAAGLMMKTWENSVEKWVPLTETDNWQKMPKVKLIQFTIKQMSRLLFADVINGMTRSTANLPLILREEFGDETIEEVTAQLESPLSVSVSEPSAEPGVRVAYPDSEEGKFTETEETDAQQYENAAVRIGSLDMASLFNRAMRAKTIDNQFHFNNLLRKLLADGTITDKMSADKILDTLKKYRAEKEIAGEEA